MANQQQSAAAALPAIPDVPVQEGARWRHHKPTSEAVAAWFSTVPLDEGMEHEHYVGGVVIIPQSEKVKYSTPRGVMERYEMTYTPYVQIGTRVFYARRLAEARKLRYVAEPLSVPRSENPASPYFNGNMAEGLWWHVVQNQHGEQLRYLCSTWQVSLIDPVDGAVILSGQGTKQVSGGADANGLMKAETGAIGRALGVAGILTVGTGIASAEDMQEYVAQPQAAPQLPPTEIAPGEPPAPAASPAERRAQLGSQAAALRARLQEAAPEGEAEFQAWWKERSAAEGWRGLQDVPLDALEGVVAKLHSLVSHAVVDQQVGELESQS